MYLAREAQVFDLQIIVNSKSNRRQCKMFRWGDIRSFVAFNQNDLVKNYIFPGQQKFFQKFGVLSQIYKIIFQIGVLQQFLT